MLKTSALVVIAVTGALTSHPTDAHAERTRDWKVLAGVHGSSEKNTLNEGGASTISSPVMIGLRLWQRLGERIAVEGELPLAVTNSRDQVATLFVTMPRIHGRYLPMGTARVTPSLVLGAGAPIVTSSKQSSVPSGVTGAAYVGAGAEMRFRGVLLGMEARYVAVPAKGDASVAHEWEFLLSFALDRRTKPKPRVRPPAPRDSDRDGVPDSRDQCPARQEDLDGFEDEDGCPELDNDGDGVIDGLDECAREAETFNGFEDDDGCADELTEDVRLLEGVITGLRFDEGSGVMDETGQEELLRLVEILRDHPSVKIEAIGHTDDQEAPAEELEALAQERADSVMQLLVELGIGHGRVFTSGLGAKEPFAENSTSGGRKANRRVEIRIHRRDPSKPDTAAPVPSPAPADVSPNPATPNPATPKPATPNPATPNPATPKPATPNPATPKPASSPN